MINKLRFLPRSFLLPLFFLALVCPAPGQALGTAGTVSGVVTDPNNAVVPNASVTIENSVTGYKRTTNTETDGSFKFNGVPPNTYSLTVNAAGFTAAKQTLNVRTSVPMTVNVPLTLGETAESVTVTSGGGNDVLENIPTSHTDVDQTLIERLPVRSPGSGLSDVVTMAAPGVVAESNGMFHPLGDHAQTTFSVDNQPISDQQSKTFSTQLPPDAVQSMEVITGATPAEYGDKTSLVVNVITKSGLGQTKPAGSFNTSYGTFGSVAPSLSLAYGGKRVGNFVSLNFERSGRFLDSPEFTVLHDRGTSLSLFDRIDYSAGPNDTFHINLSFARNHFEIPNTFDQQDVSQDQRQQVRSINLAPGYVHIFNSNTVLTINPYFRQDQVEYSPSANLFSDLPETISQSRRLTNAGIRTDLSYVKGKHNAKFGTQFSHTFLTEGFAFGITDPGFNDPASPDFIPGLLPFDLTRGGHLFNFNGHTDIKQFAAYGQDSITVKQLTLSLGLRYDNYHGISQGQSMQPRLGLSYLVRRTGTVLRASYTRSFETPYNENLILSSAAGAGGLGDGSFGAATTQALQPGNRNQFNFGFQQSIGKLLVADVDYFHKATTNAYDFATLFDTPITFPISWNNSKIDGVSFRLNLTNYKGFSAFTVAGHTRARFFPPESGGLFFNSDIPSGVFRIDHDQKFQQTTQAQYQFNQWKHVAPYVSFTWRYDSGLVAGSVPDFATALGLTPDQQAQIGLFCGNTFATRTNPLTTCTDPNRGALRLVIPADGAENDDSNPPRIAPRNLFDLSIGTDNLFGGEHKKVTLRLTAVNLGNKVALYNFLSTFSGTHFVTPRSFQVQLGLNF
ncbi:MAG TPA: TonB-dependent receptor [Pyrinomonadaceae bacterium]|nr:TonB-dependent receptor [Pyrinomonadaceae bacterium]